MSSGGGFAGVDVAYNNTNDRSDIHVPNELKATMGTYTLTCVFSLPILDDYSETDQDEVCELEGWVVCGIEDRMNFCE
jgi:hypothetical protein